MLLVLVVRVLDVQNRKKKRRKEEQQLEEKRSSSSSRTKDHCSRPQTADSRWD